ncbi:MAG: DEAD/DEAH box helicase [Chloroflexi bacterium]|nr:DEAD/DEAH box helicase [Chloroflexota bacterium]
MRASSRQALAQMGIDTPTAIQARSIPLLLAGRDVVGQAQTGSGKTLAFGLPLMERCDGQLKQVQALVLTPTRELARQVGQVLSALAKGTGIKVALVYGGRPFGPQESALAAGAQVVVGTPGRVLDHLKRRTLRLERLEVLVLDEADEMLDQGFAPDVERILAMTPRSRQTALFSATIPPWVQKIGARHLLEPEVLASEQTDGSEPDIDHVVIEAYREDKFQVLRRLLEEPTEGATLVFGRTKRGVRNLGQRLQRLGHDVAILEGDLRQEAREKVLERFRAGNVPVLVATNVAARGLDILHIERVINYELPETHELFTHRTGRTGRMGRSGRAITLVSAVDLTKWQAIERGLGRRLPRVSANGEPVAVVAAGRATRSSSWGRRRRLGRRAAAW